jgi:hypothetical protein
MLITSSSLQGAIISKIYEERVAANLKKAKMEAFAVTTSAEQAETQRVSPVLQYLLALGNDLM